MNERSAATERQRRWRQRTRRNAVVIQVEVSRAVVNALAAMGRLSPAGSDDRDLISAAISAWLSDTVKKV
jgi:hypothetical protein